MKRAQQNRFEIAKSRREHLLVSRAFVTAHAELQDMIIRASKEVFAQISLEANERTLAALGIQSKAKDPTQGNIVSIPVPTGYTHVVMQQLIQTASSSLDAPRHVRLRTHRIRRIIRLAGKGHPAP